MINMAHMTRITTPRSTSPLRGSVQGFNFGTFGKPGGGTPPPGFPPLFPLIQAVLKGFFSGEFGKKGVFRVPEKVRYQITLVLFQDRKKSKKIDFFLGPECTKIKPPEFAWRQINMGAPPCAPAPQEW